MGFDAKNSRRATIVKNRRKDKKRDERIAGLKLRKEMERRPANRSELAKELYYGSDKHGSPSVQAAAAGRHSRRERKEQRPKDENKMVSEDEDFVIGDRKTGEQSSKKEEGNVVGSAGSLRNPSNDNDESENIHLGFQTKNDVSIQRVIKSGLRKATIIMGVNGTEEYSDVEKLMTLEEIAKSLRKNLNTSSSASENEMFGTHIQLFGDKREEVKELLHEWRIAHKDIIDIVD